MKIAVMGWKADPPHLLHLFTAERAWTQHRLSQVIFMTAGQPVDKDPAKVTPKETRFGWTEAAIAFNDHFVASRIELDRDGPSYMVDTMLELRRQYGDEHEYFLIIGEDRAETITSWHDWQKLITLCTFLVAPRKSEAIDKTWLASVMPAGSKFDTIDFNYSSTFVREEIAAGRSVRYLVPDAVLAEIQANNPFAKGTKSRRHSWLRRQTANLLRRLLRLVS